VTLSSLAILYASKALILCLTTLRLYAIGRPRTIFVTSVHSSASQDTTVDLFLTLHQLQNHLRVSLRKTIFKWTDEADLAFCRLKQALLDATTLAFPVPGLPCILDTDALARWIETLAEFDYEIEHRPGRLHCNADGVSRPICKHAGKNFTTPWIDEFERADELTAPLGVHALTV